MLCAGIKQAGFEIGDRGVSGARAETAPHVVVNSELVSRGMVVGKKREGEDKDA